MRDMLCRNVAIVWRRLNALNSQRERTKSFGRRVFVIHNQYSFCEALLLRTQHDFSLKQMRDFVNLRKAKFK